MRTLTIPWEWPDASGLSESCRQQLVGVRRRRVAVIFIGVRGGSGHPLQYYSCRPVPRLSLAAPAFIISCLFSVSTACTRQRFVANGNTDQLHRLSCQSWSLGSSGSCSGVVYGPNKQNNCDRSNAGTAGAIRSPTIFNLDSRGDRLGQLAGTLR